jgi:hypothetical protein
MRAFLILFILLGTCVAQQQPAQASVDTATFGTTVVIPSGLRGEVYHLHHYTWMLPDFSRLEPVGAIWTTTLNITPRHWKDGFPGVTKRNEWFGIIYTGRFWIQKPGVYDFELTSDDGSKLFIDDQLVIDNDCQHPPLAKESSTELTGGMHRIAVQYFQGPRDCIALKLAIAGPDEDWRIFSTEEFKPPSNPEEWKFGNAGDLKVPVDPDANRRKLGNGSRKPLKESIVQAERLGPEHLSDGCLVPDPVPVCHK